MQIYPSLISAELLTRVAGWDDLVSNGLSWKDLASNDVDLEHTLAVSAVFWPDIVEDEGHVFIGYFYREPHLDQLKLQFGADKRRIERWTNAWALADFFRGSQLADSPFSPDPVLLNAFGEALQLFWSLRLKALFPERRFQVELGENIEGEDGLTITVYEEA
jgi:hypothetical protein